MWWINLKYVIAVIHELLDTRLIALAFNQKLTVPADSHKQVRIGLL